MGGGVMAEGSGSVNLDSFLFTEKTPMRVRGVPSGRYMLTEPIATLPLALHCVAAAIRGDFKALEYGTDMVGMLNAEQRLEFTLRYVTLLDGITNALKKAGVL